MIPVTEGTPVVRVVQGEDGVTQGCQGSGCPTGIGAFTRFIQLQQYIPRYPEDPYGTGTSPGVQVNI